MPQEPLRNTRRSVALEVGAVPLLRLGGLAAQQYESAARLRHAGVPGIRFRWLARGTDRGRRHAETAALPRTARLVAFEESEMVGR